jgi:hypothetical protein
MTRKTATRRAEGESSEPGQKIVTVNKNDTTTGAKNQVNSGGGL